MGRGWIRYYGMSVEIRALSSHHVGSRDQTQVIKLSGKPPSFCLFDFCFRFNYFVGILLTCMYVYHICTWCPWRSEKGVGSLETRGSDGFHLPRGCWKLNLGSPKEQPIFLTPKPSLQPLFLN